MSLNIWNLCPVSLCLFAKANILIDENGNACLADFGLLIIISDPTNPTVSSSYAPAGTTRWMSPELLDPDQSNPKDGRPTKESDCYALGMVIYEALSGKVPFAPDRDYVVMRKVIEGERPERPQGVDGVRFTDHLWYTLQLCWAHRPKGRPTIETVLQCLGPVPRDWKPPPIVGWGIRDPSREATPSSLTFSSSTGVTLESTSKERQQSESDLETPFNRDSRWISDTLIRPAGLGANVVRDLVNCACFP